MTGTASEKEVDHNPLFAGFVSLDSRNTEMLRGMVAYCLYKTNKREWATEHFQRTGRKPSEAELDAFTQTWTPSRRAGALKEADAVLADFTGEVIEDNAPQIREEALRGTFPKAVGTSMFAAFLYTLLLIGAVVILKFAGIDILSLVASIDP